MMTPAEAIILYICCSTRSQAEEERTSEARAMAISLESRSGQGASEVQDEAVGEVEENEYP